MVEELKAAPGAGRKLNICSLKPKSAMLGLVILSIVCFILAITASSAKQGEATKRAGLENRLNAVSLENSNLETQVAQVKKELAGLKDISDALARERAANVTLRDDISRLSSQMRALEAELQETGDARAALEAELAASNVAAKASVQTGTASQ